MKKIRIGIADDHLLVQYALQQLLSTKPAFEVVAFSTSGDEALKMASSCQLDILILDINMPGTSAMDVLSHIAKQAPHLKIVVYSGYSETRYALHMQRLGANGYVEKTAALDNLVAALECVWAGRDYFSQATLQRIHDSETASADALPHFTPREFQIFIRLASGEKVGHIARCLGVSIVTVSTHRSSVLRKLKLSCNPDLTKYAIENAYMT